MSKLERRRTRDYKVPLSDDDPDMNNGWRCIPMPPTNRDGEGDGWFIIDSSGDKRTEWGRWI